jgi:hypothetical protein
MCYLKSGEERPGQTMLAGALEKMRASHTLTSGELGHFHAD